MQKIRMTNSRHISWLYLFLGGFFAGTLLINIFKSFFLEKMNLLNEASISRLKYLDINNNALLGYVIRERLGIVIILGLLATTYVGLLAMNIFAAWMGLMAGVFLSVSAIRYGLKGIMLILAGILPQYFLLVPACIMLMNWCYLLCAGLYFPHKSMETSYGNKKQFLIRKTGQLTIIIGVVIIASILESYVNPTLLKIFLKLF